MPRTEGSAKFVDIEQQIVAFVQPPITDLQ
jgi:hypothetical protein